jgi:hypothetical protein
MDLVMPRETLVEVRAARDEFCKRLNITEDIMQALAKGEAPDAEDSCVLDDGTSYHFRVFRTARAHGGTILIAVTTGTERSTYYDSQYFETACEHARLTSTYSDKAWPYRDAFERLKKKVQR